VAVIVECLQSANKLSEPDPFTREELVPWRGFLRVHTHVTGELDRRMTKAHGLSLDQYAELARVWDSAVPGVVRAEVWPAAELRSRA
jgi:hypothetical protein